LARQQSRYICQACGAAHLRWEGQCRTCGAWNTLVETLVREPDHKGRVAGAGAGPGTHSAPQSLAGLREAEPVRTPTGISELDRVLGGGLVPGSVVLLGGEPGIGKSTLLLQAAAGLTATAGEVLYATGEESAGQVRLRAGRLGLLEGTVGERIRVVAENEVGRIAALTREGRPGILVVDSIQSVTVDELEGPAGSVGQVRESALRLMELAKGDGIAVIVVGHVTKDGSLAGPKTLEHLVDVVLSLEGERTATLRLLRATKNRFGSTEEIGVFEMAERGLAEVADPGRAFLAGADEHAPGSVVGATLEGTRPLLVEVQGLVAPGAYGSPRRTASGIDTNRLALLIAVLGRRAGVGRRGPGPAADTDAHTRDVRETGERVDELGGPGHAEQRGGRRVRLLAEVHGDAVSGESQTLERRADRDGRGEPGGALGGARAGQQRLHGGGGRHRGRRDGALGDAELPVAQEVERSRAGRRRARGRGGRDRGRRGLGRARRRRRRA